MALCTYKVTLYSPASLVPPYSQFILYPQWNADPGTKAVFDWAKAQALDLFGSSNAMIFIEADRPAA